MADGTKNTAATVGGVVGLVAATLLGRFLGWAFGLQLILPIIVGLVAAGRFKQQPKLEPFAAALGIMMAHLTWILLGLILDAIGGQLHFGVFWVFMLVAYVAVLVFLIVQPGPVPAALLILRHAYTLVNVLLSIPAMFRAYMSISSIVHTVISVGIAVAAIVFLARGITKNKG